MSYQSPIDIIQSKMQHIIDSTNKQLEDKIDDAVYQAVNQVGIDVDKDELLKALAYDRRQYQKGYNDRDREIIRCEECMNSKPWYGDKSLCYLWSETGIDVFNDGYCNYGKRKD